MNAVSTYVRDNAVRVYGLVVAAMALTLHYFPTLPGDLVLGLVAAALALVGGEAVQRVENRKSAEAREWGEQEAEGTLYE